MLEPSQASWGSAPRNQAPGGWQCTSPLQHQMNAHSGDGDMNSFPVVHFWSQQKDFTINPLSLQSGLWPPLLVTSDAFTVVVQSLSDVRLFATPSTPGFPVLHSLLELAQTHGH